MTKEQADEMLALLKDIRSQVTRVANAVANDGTFTAFPTATFEEGKRSFDKP